MVWISLEQRAIQTLESRKVMKLSKAILKNEHKLITKLLRKQERERRKILKKCPNLVRGWKKCWDWDEETFFDDCLDNINILIYDFRCHDITVGK